MAAEGQQKCTFCERPAVVDLSYGGCTLRLCQACWDKSAGLYSGARARLRDPRSPAAVPVPASQ
ncbi:MAG: hypothetical protein KAX19_14270 [Candidatus Brocadiae bacterium]|nr:hypothetical protein [Candidatus Brocadiia bacterium]